MQNNGSNTNWSLVKLLQKVYQKCSGVGDGFQKLKVPLSISPL